MYSSEEPLCKSRRASWRVAILALGVAPLLGGCSAFNPAFVDLFDPTGTSASVDNAPGHVAIVFVNNAEVDERLLTFLEQDLPDGGGVQLTPFERRTLRPRVRFRVQVDFVSGSQGVFEFVSGSSQLVDQRFDASAEPDLTENDLTNALVVCDVASISILGPIQVFVPVAVETYRFQEASDNRPSQFLFTGIHPDSLQFVPLQVDVVDPDGNITLQQNIGIRDIPVPVDAPRCGSVVSFVLSGSLAVPFLFDNPSVLAEDQITQARIAGRYQVRVLIN